MLRSSRALLGALLFLGLAAPLRAGNPWLSSDTDISFAHFPTKLVGDLSHLFTYDNAVIFGIGGEAVAADWASLDQKDALALQLKQWNAQPLFDFGNFYGEGWVEGFGAVGSWSLGAVVQDPRMGNSAGTPPNA